MTKKEKKHDLDIEFKNINKTYYLCNNDFQRLLLLLIPSKRKSKAKVVLNNISFKIYKGDRVALIGHNGAGKSTIMQLMVGGTIPNSGQITVNRKISSLLDVLGGIEDKFTGKDNIYIRGSILGYTKKQIDQVYDKIVEFSELGPYINQELLRYSYGMKCKLGFSINIFLHPQILLVDEALSVGDEAFNKKAQLALEKLSKKEDTTIIIISHNNQTIKKLCNRGIYLKDGKIVCDDKLDVVLKKYHQDNKK